MSRNDKLSFRVILVIVTLFWNFKLVKAQTTVVSNSVDSARLVAVDYLITNGELELDQKKGYLKFFPIYEIVNSEPLESNLTGVYSFKSFNAPSRSFILLKDKKVLTVLNPKELDYTLREMITFLKNREVDDSNIIKYIEAVLSIYKGNRYGSKARM